ncbi:MAG: helix-turn-helix domain-containing protein [Deltaproteobacteria bacterium]|nr:helix-turn-helix domain-containing protein [Deltaproteobacteria bacterium]
MKPLKLSHPSLTRKTLLREAETIPGAWNGIRIAGLLLLLAGWKSTAVSRLFGVSRQAVVDWIGKANRKGLDSVVDEPRPGRPTRMDPATRRKLEKALTKSPQDFGLHRTRWDGVVVVEFLQKVCNVQLHPRQARNWLKHLGFVLKQPIYRYIQATNEGVGKFRRGLKKNSTES